MIKGAKDRNAQPHSWKQGKAYRDGSRGCGKLQWWDGCGWYGNGAFNHTGEDLHINKLSVESSELSIEGYIASLEYSDKDGRSKGMSFLQKCSDRISDKIVGIC